MNFKLAMGQGFCDQRVAGDFPLVLYWIVLRLFLFGVFPYAPPSIFYCAPNRAIRRLVL